MSNRQSGKTTAALLTAPQGCIYVCPTRAAADYTKELARHLGRKDIQIEGLDFLRPERLLAVRGKALHMDHAVRIFINYAQRQDAYGAEYSKRFTEFVWN